MNTLENWFAAIEEKVEDPNQRNAAKDYVKNLHQKSFPIIFDLEDLALMVGLKEKTLHSIVFKPSKFYYQAIIPKRNGDDRKLNIPFPALRSLQKWIVDEILTKQSIHSAASAYFPGRSIRENVTPHLNSTELLKLDIKDFFPSINLRRVISLFVKMGYNPKLSFYLASMCCLNDELPQGAPTSPYISNLIMKRLDKRLTGLAESFRMRYTRYADDMTFSGEYVSDHLIAILNQIIVSEGFVLNHKKTNWRYKGHQKIVTGISISTNSLKLPRAKKRKIRQELYYVEKYGLLNHMKRTQKMDPIYIDRLRGRVNFLKFVEPDNKNVDVWLTLLRKGY